LSAGAISEEAPLPEGPQRYVLVLAEIDKAVEALLAVAYDDGLPAPEPRCDAGKARRLMLG
jgi:hypothetical protein